MYQPRFQPQLYQQQSMSGYVSPQPQMTSPQQSMIIQRQNYQSPARQVLPNQIRRTDQGTPQQQRSVVQQTQNINKQLSTSQNGNYFSQINKNASNFSTTTTVLKQQNPQKTNLIQQNSQYLINKLQEEKMDQLQKDCESLAAIIQEKNQEIANLVRISLNENKEEFKDLLESKVGLLSDQNDKLGKVCQIQEQTIQDLQKKNQDLKNVQIELQETQQSVETYTNMMQELEQKFQELATQFDKMEQTNQKLKDQIDQEQQNSELFQQSAENLLSENTKLSKLFSEQVKKMDEQNIAFKNMEQQLETFKQDDVVNSLSLKIIELEKQLEEALECLEQSKMVEINNQDIQIKNEELIYQINDLKDKFKNSSEQQEQQTRQQELLALNNEYKIQLEEIKQRDKDNSEKASKLETTLRQLAELAFQALNDE